ncbi:hypothetical protein GJ629_14065 [Halapricum sp. CBA1109]|jgi:hypothetical protein|uniref:DUF7127 family protein n=1 Tax=Halapricum sp. CBA1109 TaxID=2668068 RepID=UPI0012F7E7F7|nr:hypothetical protein [Halapricum sp. CBA1109]MUV90882.1 hypothetical protein [Halapricum sp. CBA1109]
MNTDQQQIGDAAVRRFEYDEAVVLAADVGVGEASVDVVGDTVIVVSDGDHHEFEVPDGAEEADARINNGVLTVEVER